MSARSCRGGPNGGTAEPRIDSLPAQETRSSRVIAVFGPTGVGKTAVGVAVAEYFGVRVVSCDSMQLYRGFPVLTNQPSSAEHEKAPHALVGVLEPEEEWSAARYAQAAATLIDEDVGRRGVAVLVGGTGLYLRAALAPLAMRTPGDPLLRAELETRAKRDGGHGLHGELASLDPEAAASIHPHNVRRTIRALEAVLAHGPGSWSGRQDLWRPDFRHPTLVVDCGPSVNCSTSASIAAPKRCLQEARWTRFARISPLRPARRQRSSPPGAWPLLPAGKGTKRPRVFLCLMADTGPLRLRPRAMADTGPPIPMGLGAYVGP